MLSVDDAYSGEPMCRISALLLLSTLVKMAQKEKDTYAIEALGRLNFIAIPGRFDLKHALGSSPNIARR